MGERNVASAEHLSSGRTIPAAPVPILLLEDNVAQALFTKRALEEEGFAVDVCRTGREGLQSLSQKDYQICLIDIRLPDTTGVELLRHIQAIRPRTVSIVVTGHGDEQMAVEAMKLGAYEYMVKGPSMGHVAALPLVIREALERLHLKDERAQLQTELWEHARLLEERNVQLRRANEELRRVNQMKSDLISTVSHELRTPLATIKEFTGIVSDQIAGPVTQAQREYLAIIKVNIDRLARIIDDLLDMAKIEAGRIVLNRDLLGVAPLVSQVVQSMQPLADNKRITLEAHVPENLPGVFADADKIMQVLTNLVSNAIKFTPGMGRVTISVLEQANDVLFSVADTGPGIALEDQPKLFEKFQQVRPTVGADGSKGTGLGLAISKRLVELHGGRIGLTSSPGQGSTFSFILPKYHMEEIFHECFRNSLEQAKRSQSRFSVIVVSLLSFQELKALYGIDEASRLLKELETVLQGAVRRRAGDVVVRWRYGEMVVILAEADQHAARAMSRRITETLERHQFTIASQAVTVPIMTASATYPDEGATENELLAVIDRRLQRPERPKTRIMVIDDEARIREFLRGVLERQEYEVLMAANGPDALEQLNVHTVDLILLDLIMPAMDGYEVYRRLRDAASTREVPIIVVSARREQEEPVPLPTDLFRHFVAKPFQVEELLGKIREVLLQRAKPR